MKDRSYIGCNVEVLDRIHSILEDSEEAFKNGVMDIPDTFGNDEAILEVLKTIERRIVEMKNIENGKTQLDDIDFEDLAYDYRCFLYLLTGLISSEIMDHQVHKVRLDEPYDKALGGIMYWFIPDEDSLADGDDGYVYYVGDSNTSQHIINGFEPLPRRSGRYPWDQSTNNEDSNKKDEEV